MKKILIKIQDNSLVVKERIKLSTEYKSILNTNVISCNELVFSDDYIENNKKIVATFLDELTKNYNVDTIILENNSFAFSFMQFYSL